jgi:hypothetical protein
MLSKNGEEKVMPENQASVSDQIAEGPHERVYLFETTVFANFDQRSGDPLPLPAEPDEVELLHEISVAVGRFYSEQTISTRFAATRETRGTPQPVSLLECPWEFRPDAGPSQTACGMGPSLDEVVASKIASFHLERMDSNCYWIGLDLLNGQHIRVIIQSRSKKAHIHAWAEAEGIALGVMSGKLASEPLFSSLSGASVVSANDAEGGQGPNGNVEREAMSREKRVSQPVAPLPPNEIEHLRRMVRLLCDDGVNLEYCRDLAKRTFQSPGAAPAGTQPAQAQIKGDHNDKSVSE